MTTKQDAMERAMRLAKELLQQIYPCLEGTDIDELMQETQEIADALLAFRKEGLEEAAKIAESHAWDYSSYPSRVGLVQGIAQAIRKLEE